MKYYKHFKRYPSQIIKTWRCSNLISKYTNKKIDEQYFQQYL